MIGFLAHFFILFFNLVLLITRIFHQPFSIFLNGNKKDDYDWKPFFILGLSVYKTSFEFPSESHFDSRQMLRF